MAMPTTHRSLSNTLVHYHFVYNLPLYFGLMNQGGRSGNTRGGDRRGRGRDDEDEDELELTRLARQLGYTYDIHPVNVPPLYSLNPVLDQGNSNNGNQRRSDRDRPGAIVRRKQRIAAYSDYLEQATYFADVERVAGAACDHVLRGWDVASGGSECESDEEGLSRGGLRNRLKSGLEKVKQRTGQAKVRGSEMTGKLADKIKMKKWKRKAEEKEGGRVSLGRG
ncbi:hypothetical protein DV738_g3900, partial [Chaetothyriales sp. CBS 135597]